jgi:tetratricopeptide (TPR) repeat protein
VLRAEHRCDEAIPEYEMAIALNRNSANALFSLGLCKLLTGSIDETIQLEEQAIRLSPRDLYVFNRYLVIGEVHLLQSRTEEAIVWLERARAANPGSVFPRAWLASAYALKGDVDHAINELTEAHRLGSSGGDYSIKRMRGALLGDAGYPCPTRSHFFRRPAQGGDAGGVRVPPYGTDATYSSTRSIQSDRRQGPVFVFRAAITERRKRRRLPGS